MARGTIRPDKQMYDILNEEREEYGWTWDQYLERLYQIGQRVDHANRRLPEIGEGDGDAPSHDEIREIVREETRAAIDEARR